MESREYHGVYTAVEFLWITLAPSVFLLHLFYLRPIGWTFEPLDSWLRSDFFFFFFSFFFATYYETHSIADTIVPRLLAV